MTKKIIKIAIQKQGRLLNGSKKLLEKIGLEFDNGKNDQLLVSCRNFPLQVVYLRDDDIPEYVQDSVADLGMVGQNMAAEKSADVSVLEKLRFGYCRLCIAIPQNSRIKKMTDLQNKTIATSYPNSLNDFLNKTKVKAKIVELKGSVELAPNLKIADAICDLVSSGNTIRSNNLTELATVLRSEAVLITNKKSLSQKGKREIIEQFLMRIRAVLKAAQTKYVLMNAPTNKVKNIIKIVPGLESPTVVPLANKKSVAIHSVVPEDTFWQVIERLKKAGARDILILPIEKIIN